MKLIKDEARNAFECSIIDQHSGENALGKDFDSCIIRNLAFESYPIADGFSHGFSQNLCHPFGYLASSQAARFEHQNLTLIFKMIMDETFQCLITHAPQNGEREEGRFTGSRRSCNNKVSRLHQCFIDRVGYLVSWQMTSLLFYSI